MSSVCPHCRTSAEPSMGRCPACGAESPPGLASGDARVFEGGPSDAGLRFDDGATACPVAFGPYRVLGLIGKGGMGLVYHAIHRETREEVAVKTVRVRKRGMLHRIRREINALARIEHPGLVRVIETGQTEGQPWYAMELLRGRSLQDRMREGDRPDKPVDFVLAMGSDPASAVALSACGTTATVGIDPPALRFEAATTADDGTPAIPFPPWPESLPDPDPDPDPDPPSVPGLPIAEGARRDFLVLMARLCETLAYLHGEGIVHRDIKPQNVIIRPDGWPVLLDFGLASRSGAGGRESLEVGGTVEGTPEYMSPEQIRGEYVDARSDLYSIGCILYEGATGRVPFQASTPGGTLRAHLRDAPPPPRSIRADVPADLERLILHLLAKKAEERLGFARDIIDALDRLGCGSPSWEARRPSRDYLYRPRFIGRASTLARSEGHVRRALGRPGHCIFLRGQTGVGKTRFIMELARQLELGGLTVATGECLPIGGGSGEDDGPSPRSTPLHPFRPFLQMVADCCLERGCEEVARLLGPGGGVLALCEPSLADLPGAVDSPPSPPEDDGQGSLHSRLIEALGQTLTEFGRTSPLVVLLDDLEWADALTLHFLALFHVGVWDVPNVAIVATYRSEAEGPAIRDYRPVFRDGTFLEIEPLEPASLGEIVRDMLGSHQVDDRFVGHLARRSGGNPFFVAEFLRASVAEGVLRRDASGCWRVGKGVDGAERPVDADSLDLAIGLPESLHELVVRRLAGLPDDARKLLELAAVVGREVDAELLESVEPIGEVRTLAALASLLLAQVLDEGSNGRFRFAHDKLREVAYDQIPPPRRRALHRSVALAIEATPSGQGERPGRTATLAHHWYRSIGDPTAEPEAVSRAIEHLEAATRQAVHDDLPAEAVSSGRAAARLLGVDLPEAAEEIDRALAIELREIAGLIGARGADDLLELPRSTDPAADRLAELLLTMQPPAFLSGQIGLFALMASKVLTLTLRSGLGPRAASAFAMAALVRRIILEDARGALEFSELAVELDRRAGGTHTAEVLFLKGWFVGHWVAPTRETLPEFDRGARLGRASGEVLYTCYNHAAYLALLAAGGEPLGRLIEEADARIARVGWRVIIARFHCVLERQVARALAGLTDGPTSLSDASFDEARDLSFVGRSTNANQVGFYQVARLKLCYYQGEYAEALRAADEAMAVAGSFARQPAEVDLVFFRALALLAIGDPVGVRDARNHLATLRRWRADCEANFGHKALLVQAEVARAEGLESDARRFLDAARSADEAGFPHHAALARELAARHLARLGEDPGPLRRMAAEGYRAWGAKALADRLEIGS